MVKSTPTIIDNGFCQKMGDIVVMALQNAFASTPIPSTGHQIQYTAKNISIFPCLYYSGNAQPGNVNGFLKIQDNKLYLLDSTLSAISKTYITGTIVFINA